MTDSFSSGAWRARFETERELKASKRGSVLLVRDRSTHKRYVYREFEGSGEVCRRIQGLDCPYLPQIERVEEADGRTAVLEEYIEGDTLAFVLEGGTLPEGRAKTIAIQVLRALEALHSIGAVHRDVKPENILLRGGEAMLIDFDASRLVKLGSDTDTRVMGTTGYAAPEQYGFTQTDARADIYSVGVLLNEMLTRRHPSAELASGSMRPVIEKCLEVNVDKRYASAAEVIEALETAEKTARQRRARRPALIAAAVAAALAAAIMLALSIRTRNDTPWRLERLAVSETVWEGEDPWESGRPDSSRTEFRYDLDGDGENEAYLFAVGMTLPGRRPGGTDSRVLTGDIAESVTAAPCVWRMDEDGNYVVVYEFAELLTEPTSELICMEQWGASEPEVWAVTPMDEYWNGAIEAVYTADCAGRWLYRTTARLDGELLTATAMTVIERAPAL